ncbi:UNVERIFIED_CONTAM: tagD [Trichonephila clavipes]
MTFGTFDLFHVGHANLLQRAAALGDMLLVGISTDELNYNKKGRKPIYCFEDRLKIVSSLRYVNFCFPEESLEKKLDYLKRYKADVLVMGNDWEVARLLTPEEIGIYAISSVVALAFAEFKTLGAGIYLVREKTLDENKVRASLGYSGSIIVQVILLNFVYRHSSMMYKPSFRGLKPILSLGAYTSFAAFLKKANTLLPDAVIGKLGSATHVAMFSRGFGFSQFIFMTLRNGVGAVSLSYLSTVRREGGDISDAYTNGSYLFNGLAFPVLAVASLLSLPAIRLLFGDQWDQAAPIASCFMIWAAFRAVNFQFNDLAVAVGRPKLQVLREAGIKVFY